MIERTKEDKEQFEKFLKGQETKYQKEQRIRDAALELYEACREIHKIWLCPEPKTMKDWSARCDVMADYARQAIQKAEGREER